MLEKKMGGARPGAGRKPTGEPRKEKYSAAMTATTLDAVRQEARRRGISVSALLEELVEAARIHWPE